MLPGALQWPGLRLDLGTAQIQGCRARQEDSYVVRVVETGLVTLVADGLGGQERGDEASAAGCVAAAQVLMKELGATPDWGEALTRAFEAGHEEVLSLGRTRPHGPASTLVGGVMVPETRQFHCANLGDSLAWLWREGRLFPLFAEVDSLLGRVLGGSGGTRDRCVVDVAPALSLQPCDRLLLASDGLLSLPREVISIGLAYTTARAICEALIGELIERQQPDQDNVTLVVIKVNAP